MWISYRCVIDWKSLLVAWKIIGNSPYQGLSWQARECDSQCQGQNLSSGNARSYGRVVSYYASLVSTSCTIITARSATVGHPKPRFAKCQRFLKNCIFVLATYYKQCCFFLFSASCTSTFLLSRSILLPRVTFNIIIHIIWCVECTDLIISRRELIQLYERLESSCNM